ncbi:acyl transferase/acyl hydrolase/lysophospholipase [Xylaria longipes]|nr:acyl transferase/acyl hydrolase/lysophospholipase [Xylaria longipes]
MCSKGPESLQQGKGLCLLSLDGGGIRGLSSLYLLKKLMETVSSQNPPKSCQYFDMIGGTSTGGLIAIMLARLEMSVDECIEAYKTMSPRIFTKLHHRITMKGKIQGRFRHTALEQAVQELPQSRGLKKDELLRKTGPNFCKTFVCATSKQSGRTVILSSYLSQRRGRDSLDITPIWQAVRATSAATSFFDPNIEIWNEEFIDGATPDNNPLMELWSEAHDVFSDPDDRSWNLENNVACMVSIGTGVPAAQSFGDDLLQIGAKLVKIATDTEKVASDFAKHHPQLVRDGRYFRFNVDRGLENIGLEEHARLGEIMAATRHYIQTEAVYRSMVLCSLGLSNKHSPEKNYLFACNESESEGLRALRLKADQVATLFDVNPSSEVLSVQFLPCGRDTRVPVRQERPRYMLRMRIARKLASEK